MMMMMIQTFVAETQYKWVFGADMKRIKGGKSATQIKLNEHKKPI